ncbi:MAG UNVERIFIED_CONTAM: hypothetical protein LVQ98_06775 [Rickettsiaceae bacterium]|jgi:hypothetical protein
MCYNAQIVLTIMCEALKVHATIDRALSALYMLTTVINVQKTYCPPEARAIIANFSHSFLANTDGDDDSF